MSAFRSASNISTTSWPISTRPWPRRSSKPRRNDPRPSRRRLAARREGDNCKNVLFQEFRPLGSWFAATSAEDDALTISVSFLPPRLSRRLRGGCRNRRRRRAARSRPACRGVLRSMTLEEKAGQLSIYRSPKATAQVNPLGRDDPTREPARADVRFGRSSGYFNGFDVAFHRELQRIAVEETRLVSRCCSAPTSSTECALRSDPAGRGGEFRAGTGRAHGAGHGAGGDPGRHPVDLRAHGGRGARRALGPGRGRAGEDTLLGCRFAAARVRGFQGSDLTAEDSMLA